MTHVHMTMIAEEMTIAIKYATMVNANVNHVQVIISAKLIWSRLICMIENVKNKEMVNFIVKIANARRMKFVFLVDALTQVRLKIAVPDIFVKRTKFIDLT